MQIIPMSYWMKSDMMFDVGYVHVHEHQGHINFTQLET